MLYVSRLWHSGETERRRNRKTEGEGRQKLRAKNVGGEKVEAEGGIKRLVHECQTRGQMWPLG